MIRSFDYRRALPEVEEELVSAFREVLHSGSLILGPQTAAFEEEFARFVGAGHCVSVSSGTAALHLALAALGVGPGDEIITVANTCVPTVAAIRLTGAVPVFVDIDPGTMMIDTCGLARAVTAFTRCILPVHLWGQSAPMRDLMDEARRFGLRVVEDCAQAHGTMLFGRHVGTFGDVGCFSFYPTKNLGAYGDAGAVVTSDAALAERCRMLRMYGYDDTRTAVMEGFNYRISELQAAMLRVGMRGLGEKLKRRRHLAGIYDEGLPDNAWRRPMAVPGSTPAYHQYVVRCTDRRAVTDVLRANDIEYGIHYPRPVHTMPAYRFLAEGTQELPYTCTACREVLSLPLHPELTDEEVMRVCGVLSRR